MIDDEGRPFGRATVTNLSARHAPALVSQVLRDELPHLAIEGPIEPLASGLGSDVYRARSGVHGEVAVRVPKPTKGGGGNDLPGDPRSYLRQETELARLAGQMGVPTLEVLHLHLGRVPLMVSRFLANDDSWVREGALAALAAQLHDIRLGAVRLAEQRGRATASAVAERLHRRLTLLRSAGWIAGPAVNEESLRTGLGRLDEHDRLLHLDLRPGNVLMRRGTIAAVVDWDNAMSGDPWFEVARLIEYGEAGTCFLAAYRDLAPVEAPDEATAELYSLDTAVMLAIVFLYEAPNPTRAEQAVSRVRELVDRAL